MAQEYDVIVVGAGNAALSAAIAARESCQSVLVVEKAPEYFRGGPVRFAFPEDRLPAKSRLGALQDEKLEPQPVVMDQNAPFLVVIGDAEGCGSPGAACWHGLWHRPDVEVLEPRHFGVAERQGLQGAYCNGNSPYAAA